MWNSFQQLAIVYMARLQDYLNVKDAPMSRAEADQTKLLAAFSIAIGIAGATATLLIIVGGIKYMLSKGDPGATSQAMKTIIYAGVGLVVSMLAFAIVQFVMGKV